MPVVVAYIQRDATEEIKNPADKGKKMKTRIIGANEVEVKNQKTVTATRKRCSLNDFFGKTNGNNLTGLNSKRQKVLTGMYTILQ